MLKSGSLITQMLVMIWIERILEVCDNNVIDIWLASILAKVCNKVKTYQKKIF